GGPAASRRASRWPRPAPSPVWRSASSRASRWRTSTPPTISSRPAPWCASTPAPPPRTRRPEMAISLTAQPTVPGSQVLAYGAARGDLVVPNDDLVGPIDSSDEWIRQRTGIVTRKRASAEVGVKDLSLTAATEAVERSGIDLETLDAIIVSPISFPYATPSLATLLAGELGRPDVIAYDISAACAGFAYGIGQADALIRSGAARHVLVIGAEKLSD